MTRLLWRFAAMLAAICAATLLVGGYLTENTLRSAQQEAFTARFALASQRAATAAENALALGVPLAPDTPLAGLLAREAALEPALSSFAIDSVQGEALLAVAGRPAATHGAAQASTPIRNDLGQTVAWARLQYDDSALSAAQQRLHQAVLWAVWPALALMCAALGLLCVGLVARLRRQSRPLGLPGGERVLLTVASALLLGAALAWVGWQAGVVGRASIQPDQIAKAQAMARSSAALIARALEVGVPADALVGVKAHAAALHAQSPEIAELAFLTPGGRLLAGTAPAKDRLMVRAPVLTAVGQGQQVVGEVVLALDPGVLTRRLQATLLDLAFLGAICLLMALELLALGLGTRGARALAVVDARRSRQMQSGTATQPWRTTGAATVRPALFLFMLAEELTRPFLPTWARALAPADGLLSPSLLASLPLVVFLAVVALLQWPLTAWSERFGRRSGLVLGALLGAVGLALAAALPGYAALVAARLLGAVGFAMVFVSAQGAAIDGSASNDRARSLAQFVRAILVAGLCGPPLGGLVVDRWGAPAAFALAVCVALLAAAVAWRQMPAHSRGVPQPAAAVQGFSWSAMLRQPGLGTLLLGCALPAKLLLAALCFYLLPMYLQDMGYGSAVTGRLQTIYPLTMVLLVPLAARLADRWRRRGSFVVVGGVLAGASAMLAWPLDADPMQLALILLGLGLGQALSITPQSALIADLARSLPTGQGAGLLGLFRLTERGGSALGPALGAWLLPAVGFSPAVAVIGALVLGGSLAYGCSLRWQETLRTRG
ncbi:MAG: MFS transporter [Comamonas sp.]|jgi:predicted MFS family arabinose efflux permease|nr:MFS transporter [Comamonas sp.]